MKIAIDKIEPDPKQPRKIFTVDDLETLADSIRENGLIQPITVRPATKRGRYWINYGERRWRSHGILVQQGFKRFAQIEAIVEKPSIVSLRVKQVVENVQRADFKPLEEAQAYQDLVDELELTPEDAAKRVGIPLHRFNTRRALLRLDPSISQLVAAEQFDINHALEIARLPNLSDQMKIFQMISRGELGHWRSVRHAVSAMLESKTAIDLFGDSEPIATAQDVEALTAMEQKIERAAALLSSGWRDGECIVANKVSPDRAAKMADKLMTIRSAVRHMEKELRNTTAQARIVLAS